MPRALVLFLLAALPARAASGETRDLTSSLVLGRDVRGASEELVATGPDPFVTFPLEPGLAVDPDTEIALEMRARASLRGITLGQLFLKERPEGDYKEPRSVKFAVAMDGAWHRYRVPLAFPGAPPRVSGVRLDPFSGAGTFAIKSVLIGPRARPAGDPSALSFDAPAIDRDWLPGPGLEPLGSGRYRVRGPDAFLLCLNGIAVDARRTTQCEVDLRSEMAPARAGRLCYGPDPLGSDAGCVTVPAGAGRHYLSMLLQPGWNGTIRRLRLLPLGEDPPEGAIVAVSGIRTVPFHADPLTSIFVRKADFLRRHNPTVLLGLLLSLLGSFLFASTILLEWLSHRRPTTSPGGGPRGLVDLLSLASVAALVVMLCLFPFESYPLLSTPFLHGLVDLPGVVLLFALFLGVTRRIFFMPRGSAVAAVERPALLFLAVVLLSSLFSLDRATSLAYLERHYLSFVAALLAGAYAPVDRRAFQPFLVVLCLATCFLAGLGVIQAIGFKGFLYGDYFRAFQPIYYHANIRPKAFSTLGNPVPLATVLLGLCPIALFTSLRGSGATRRLGIVTTAVGLLCFFLTMSRGAHLALLTALPAYGWLVPKGARRRILLLGLAVALAASAIIVLRRPRGAVHPITMESAAPLQDAQAPVWFPEDGSRVFVAQRLLGARIALRIFRRYPLLGAGFGQVGRLYDQMLPPEAERRNPVWSTADDFYLTMLAEGGLLGLAAILLLLFALARVFILVGRRRSNGDDGPLARACLAALIGFAAHMAVYDGLYWFTAPVIVASVLGLSIAAIVAMGEARKPGAAACP